LPKKDKTHNLLSQSE